MVNFIFSINKTLLKSEKKKIWLAKRIWPLSFETLRFRAWVTFTISKQTETYENDHNTLYSTE